MVSNEPDDRATPEAKAVNSAGAEQPSGERVRLLRRSRTDEVIGGVAGGLGRYFGVDPVLIRIAFVALAFLTFGTMVLLYIVAWIVIPEEREGEIVEAGPTASPDTARLFIGGALILLGVFFLMRIIIPWFDTRLIWALVLILLGVAVLVRSIR